ncbi:general stress protein [Staphylococcus arlettae]|uniref:general stress protein n=1 Tax=Staphylococcus arlettae TaxID=29378 RepID=UPI0034DDB18C
MTEFTVVDNAEALYQAIDGKRAEGYKDYELTVLSKSKLHLDELHDSEINLTSTGGTFSDKVAKIMTGEDTESVVLANYNLSDEASERYKKELMDNKFILVSAKDTSSHEEVNHLNAAYDEKILGKHFSEETRGPKS